MPVETHVLIITYYWPPAGGPGVQRWLKMSKYLSVYGLKPIILTVDPEIATYPLKDESLVNEVPQDMKVFYTDSFEPFGMYQKATGRKEVPFSGFANESDKPGPRQKISKFVRGNFFLPDARKGWNKFAYIKAKKLIADYNIETIITTGPPHSTHLIGLKLKRTKQVKWLADFRDPWTDIYYYNELYPTRLAKSLDKKMEKSVLINADYISVVSNDMKKLFANKVGSKNIIEVIPNGYDHKDFNISVPQKKESKFELLYAGTITKQYPIKGLLKAITLIKPDLQKKLVLRFIGKRDELTEKMLLEFNNCEVILEGYLPHDLVVKEMLMSNALLLIIPDIDNNKGILTGKIYEYLGSQKPILCIGPKGCDAETILNQTNSGLSFDYVDREIAICLENWVLNKELPSPIKEEIEKYSRKKLTMHVANLIHKN